MYFRLLQFSEQDTKTRLNSIALIRKIKNADRCNFKITIKDTSLLVLTTSNKTKISF